jgi:hypothetical protein
VIVLIPHGKEVLVEVVVLVEVFEAVAVAEGCTLALVPIPMAKNPSNNRIISFNTSKCI